MTPGAFALAHRTVIRSRHPIPMRSEGEKMAANLDIVTRLPTVSYLLPHDLATHPAFSNISP